MTCLIDIPHCPEAVGLICHIVSLANIWSPGFHQTHHICKFQSSGGDTAEFIGFCQLFVSGENLALHGFPNEEWTLLDSSENFTNSFYKSLNCKFRSISGFPFEFNFHFVNWNFFGNIILREFRLPPEFPADILLCLANHGEIKPDAVPAKRPTPEKSEGFLLNLPLIQEFSDIWILVT